MSDGKLYKCLAENGIGPLSGELWRLPYADQPGRWMPRVKGELRVCWNGYHLVRREQVWRWLSDELYEAEGRGDTLDGGNKVVFRQARLLRRVESWNERTARLLCCDLAELMIPFYEALYRDGKRLRRLVDVARRYANGETTADELHAAESTSLMTLETYRYDYNRSDSVLWARVAAQVANCCCRPDPFTAINAAIDYVIGVAPRGRLTLPGGAEINLPEWLTFMLFSYLDEEVAR